MAINEEEGERQRIVGLYLTRVLVISSFITTQNSFGMALCSWELMQCFFSTLIILNNTIIVNISVF